MTRHGLNPLSDLKTYRELKRIVETEAPWGVVNYTIKPVIYGSLAAHAAGVENIFSNITGLGYVFSGTTAKLRLVRSVVEGMYRRALRHNRRVFFQNPDDQQLFLDQGLLEEKQAHLINGSGIDTERFRPTEPRVVEPTFIQITRLLPDKGVREYAEAARRLKGKHPKARFLLVGPTDEYPGSIKRDTLDRWQKEGGIEYAGALRDVRDPLSQAAVYVFPSYREGTPRSVLEAMAMGKPIVTTDVPGCRQTVTDGKSGFLVPPRDSAALADAMEKFILDPNLIQEMGAKARTRAVERFDVRRVNSSILGAMGLHGENPA